MVSQHQRRTHAQTPELVLSDSEELYPSSEDEMTERDQTDHLLRQAHHYVITEGGNDSPATFVDRIQRIDRGLLQQISEQGYDCDPKLYRRVRQKVDHVQREFEDAIDADSSVYHYEEMPEYYTAAAEEALYRGDSDFESPGQLPSKQSKAVRTEHESVKTYLYGGPDSEPEHWYKTYPASLPFPETIRMADWESLRIHHDLTVTGNPDIKKPVTSAGVSFKHPSLVHHDNLAQYESGSRFKLPLIVSEELARVYELGADKQLYQLVETFNQGDNTKDRYGEYKYAPRVFLEKLHVGTQNGIDEVVNEVRSVVNITPTKSYLNSSGSNRLRSTPSATRALVRKQQQTSTSVLCKGNSSYIIEHDNSDGVLLSNEQVHGDKLQSHKAAAEPSSRNKRANSPAIRRIKYASDDAIRTSPQPQSPPVPTQAPVSTHVATHGAKPARDHPCKNPVPETAPPYQPTACGAKRKRPSRDTSYKPTQDAESDEEAEGYESEIEVLPAKRKRTVPKKKNDTPKKTVRFSVGDGEAVVTPKSTVSSPLDAPISSAPSIPPVGKAKAAGKQVRKTRTKHDFEERVTPERYVELMEGRKGVAAEGHEGVRRGRTRSGKVKGV